jgi:hypothetical protein
MRRFARARIASRTDLNEDNNRSEHHGCDDRGCKLAASDPPDFRRSETCSHLGVVDDLIVSHRLPFLSRNSKSSLAEIGAASARQDADSAPMKIRRAASMAHTLI